MNDRPPDLAFTFDRVQAAHLVGRIAEERAIGPFHSRQDILHALGALMFAYCRVTSDVLSASGRIDGTVEQVNAIADTQRECALCAVVEIARMIDLDVRGCGDYDSHFEPIVRLGVHSNGGEPGTITVLAGAR